jgi:hypothetical protein
MILEEYQKSNGFVIKVNYRYMKILLDHLAFQKPLYIYEQFFIDFAELKDQLAALKYLAQQDVHIARKFWANLAHHNPGLYKDNFQYTGDDCLFSRVLNLYNKVNIATLDQERLHSLSSPMEKFEHILNHTKQDIISKELLINLIWNESPNQRNQGRLRKLIYDFKKKNNTFSLTSRQSTYIIKKVS